MDKSSIFCLVAWLVLLAIVVVLLAIGVKPQDMLGEFFGLASPLLYLLVRKRDRK